MYYNTKLQVCVASSDRKLVIIYSYFNQMAIFCFVMLLMEAGKWLTHIQWAKIPSPCVCCYWVTGKKKIIIDNREALMIEDCTGSSSCVI